MPNRATTLGLKRVTELPGAGPPGREVPGQAFRSDGKDDRSLVLLPAIWASLEQGQSMLVDHFFSANRCYAVLRSARNAEVADRRLSRSQRALLRRVLLGEQQKTIAIELGISATAVTLRARRCIHRLGLDCRPSGLPLFVLISALAFHGRIPSIAQARLVQGDGVRVYSIPRLDIALPASLSQAECVLTRLLVEGHSQSVMAERRGTALRTVANQMGSVFTKLGVCGRLDLIRVLATRALSAQSERPRPAVFGVAR